ncbi:MAG: hypothetical protein KY475_24990 [Planctomycetes bacterium]|nr:hypothetical protein [Planctomycetota bacterium]
MFSVAVGSMLIELFVAAGVEEQAFRMRGSWRHGRGVAEVAFSQNRRMGLGATGDALRGRLQPAWVCRQL